MIHFGSKSSKGRAAYCLNGEGDLVDDNLIDFDDTLGGVILVNRTLDVDETLGALVVDCTSLASKSVFMMCCFNELWFEYWFIWWVSAG